MAKDFYKLPNREWIIFHVLEQITYLLGIECFYLSLLPLCLVHLKVNENHHYYDYNYVIIRRHY